METQLKRMEQHSHRPAIKLHVEADFLKGNVRELLKSKPVYIWDKMSQLRQYPMQGIASVVSG